VVRQRALAGTARCEVRAAAGEKQKRRRPCSCTATNHNQSASPSFLRCTALAARCVALALRSLELGSSLCRCESEERLKWKRWKTMLLIVMLESSSRSAPGNKALLMACSTALEVWRSTIIEVSCSLSIAETIECKYSRVMMMMAARSCPSSARKATNQASSTILMALRSITIMIASSSLIGTTI